MKFQKAFQRRVGGSGSIPVLGDAAPSGNPALNADNVVSFQPFSDQGWPVHRLALGLSTSTSPAQVRVDLWFWDELSWAWYKMNQEPKYLLKGQLTFFDTMSVARQPLYAFGDALAFGDGATAGGPVTVYVQTLSDANLPNGTYTFAFAPDATTVGDELPDVTAPARRVRAVTPNDSNDLPDGPCRSLWCSTGGVVNLIAKDDTVAVEFTVLAGTVLPVEARRVKSTNTSATVVALY